MNKRDLAISWIRDYLPELDEAANLDELQIEPNEFRGANLTRWTADAVYSVPLRNAPNHLKLALILEHKSRLKESEQREAIAQTATYLCSQCLLEAKTTSSGIIIPHPLAAVVYTGSNKNLTKLSWEDHFPLPPQLKRWGMSFDLEVVNMPNLLAEGKSPENEWLEIMYNVMTRSKARELDGYEHSAFLPLLRHNGEWTETDSERAAALTTLFSAHIQKVGLKEHDKRIATLFDSVNLEKKMGTDALYRMFAPAAQQYGIGIGVQQGIDIGVQQGIQQERTAALEAQRQELCSAVEAKFGSCPKALQSAFDKIDELNALIKLHIFALTEARSVTDVLERARSARR